MLIFVYGEDTYSSGHKVEEMRKRFVEKFDPSRMNLVEFEGAKVGEVMSAIQSPPFLGSKRMIIIKELMQKMKKPDAAPWVEAFGHIPESTIVIVWDKSSVAMTQKNALFVSLRDADTEASLSDNSVHAYPFPEFDEGALITWSRSHAKEIGLTIAPVLLDKVAVMVGSDLWQLSGELAKLKARSAGSSVTPEMIADLVSANLEDQMFAFMDAITAGDKRQAISLLENQRQTGSEDMQLIGMLARQIRLLISARSVVDANPRAGKSEIAQELGVHPFVAQKLVTQVRAFEMSRLQQLHDRCFAYDRDIKRGGIAMDIAVDRLVAAFLTK